MSMQNHKHNNTINVDEYTPLINSSSLPSLFMEQASGMGASDVEAQNFNGSDDGFNFQQQPSTSRSNENLGPRKSKGKRQGEGKQGAQRHKKNKKRLRTHSDTDLRKMKWDQQDLRKVRPIIASPFMPNLVTQFSVEGTVAAQDRRRTLVGPINDSRAPAGPPKSTTKTTAANSKASVPKTEEVVLVGEDSPATISSKADKIAPSSAVRIVGQSKYGSLPSNKGAMEDGQVGIINAPTTKLIDAESSSSSEEDEDEDESSSSSSSDSDSSTYTRFSDLTKKQWATVGMLAIANLCSTIAFSCIAPFYPAEAQKKGMSTSEVGIVFGIFELVMFVTAPLLGKYMPLFGSKLMFTVGLFITGITAILFGFLNFLPASRLFFWASLFVRCAEALGDACFVTSSFAISAKCFPGRIATIVGIMETFAGLGYTAGPVIGSVLYEYGGFQMPFLVLGILLILATFFSYYLVEDIEDEPSEDAMGMLSMLKIPVIWLMVFAVVICAISLSFFDPTLADHLATFNLSTINVGLMFLLCGGIYTLTAPLWGLILDRWHCCNLLMLLGSSVTVISMIFVGPSPLLNMEKSLFCIGFSLAILGVSAGALYIPTFQNCLDAVKENGYDDSFQTYGCVSGVFQSAFAFGAFIGPTLGALSVQTIGFPWTTTIIAGVNMIFILTLLVFFVVKKCHKRSEMKIILESP